MRTAHNYMPTTTQLKDWLMDKVADDLGRCVRNRICSLRGLLRALPGTWPAALHDALARLENDLFADCFVARGQAMLDLISRTMRKPSIDGREVFRGALDSAGLSSEPYGSDDEVEYDPVGEGAYGDDE